MADGQDRKERLEKLRREREAKVKELDDKITNKESSMRKGLQARQGLDQVVCSLFCMLTRTPCLFRNTHRESNRLDF